MPELCHRKKKTGHVRVMEQITVKCRGVMGGKARAEALVTTQPISFWGGIDPKTGLIIDKRNECYGKSISGRVFVFPYGKGSSTSSAVFLEAVRSKKAPVAIVNTQTEPLLAVGAILAERLYGISIPIVQHVQMNPCELIEDGDFVEVDADMGVLTVTRAQHMRGSPEAREALTSSFKRPTPDGFTDHPHRRTVRGRGHGCKLTR